MFLFYPAVPFVLIVTVFYSILAAATRPIDRNARIYHSLMRQWSHALLFLLRVKVTVRGLERLTPGTPYLFLANHSSYLDIIAVGAALPEGALLVYKEELTKIPIWGWSLKRSPFIMIRRADARDAMRSIERAAEEIRQRGQSVVIFPEGTRSADGTLGQFKRGGFLIAAKAGVPLVPLAIRGAQPLMPRSDWRVRPGNVQVIVGNPIPGRADLNRNEERLLLEDVRNQLVDLLGE